MASQLDQKRMIKIRMKFLIIIFLILPAVIKSNGPVAGLDDIWRRRTDMPTARINFAAVEAGGKVYVIGGENEDGVLKIVEEYDPVTNSWLQRAEMPTARYGLAAVVLNDKIYTLGGLDKDTKDLQVVEIYDPVTNNWSKQTELPTKRGFLSATVLNGKIYTMGGAKWRQEDENWNVLDDVEVYDPSTNNWTSRADLLDNRFNFEAVTVGENLYAVGGLDYLEGEKELSPRESVEKYNPDTDSWDYVKELPTQRSEFATAVIGGRIFVIGGIDEKGNPMQTVETYEPKEDRWSRWADMPTPRSKIEAVTAGGWIYVFGGFDGVDILGTVETYEPPSFDSDGDGLADSDEIERYGTNPIVADADSDTDGDGLTNVEEVDIYGTNIASSDTDGDGFTDKEEIDARTNPIDPKNHPITTTVPEGANWMGFLGMITIPIILLGKKRKTK